LGGNPPTVQISKLVNSLKGVSNRMLSKDRPDLKKYNTKAMWSPSYFAASCGGAPLSKIADYVRSDKLNKASAFTVKDWPLGRAPSC
jgi:putative transposase